MEKQATTRFPIHDVISRRWSPRAFADESISVESLGSLMEAARWSASCFNEQPWRFIVARREDAEAFSTLANCLVPFNRGWAEKASLLVLCVAAKTFARNGKANAHGEYDLGLAVGGLSAQATAMGLAVHQMAGFDPEKARETYAIPEDFTPKAMMAIGYPGNPEELDEGLKEQETAPRDRKPLEEVVFRGSWGEAHSWG